MKYKQTWNLESIFPGGSRSTALQEKLTNTLSLLDQYHSVNANWDFEKDKPGYIILSEIFDKKDEIQRAISQASSFINAVQSANVKDTHAGIVKDQVSQLRSRFSIINTSLTKKIAAISEKDFNDLLQLDCFSPIQFALTEIREEGSRLLSEPEEKILSMLRPDGFNGWSSHYNTLVSFIKIPVEDKNGKIQELSAGQAMNRMYSDPDPEIRKKIFGEWEKAWGENAPLFADTLNRLQGFRLADYQLHGVDDFLEKPLRYNRIQKETLDTMWNAISSSKQPFFDFLDRKAALMGKDKLAWYDVEAPISVGDFEPRTFSYDEAVDFIVENFRTFGPKLADFAQNLVDKQWVEAEDRAGKRPGGYCTGLPESKESRIFMTFTGSSSDMSTLAHEIGHAFHSYTMWDLPLKNTNYAMNVAETASTFAETLVSSATVDAAKSDEEKISLLDTKLEGATSMFMNIHSRFLFEKSFYAERQEGLVSADRLSELMEAAQKEAYQDHLSELHPHFWASKLHFFIDNVPFYNFPYTFGFLFSLSIFAEYKKNPDGFEEKYIALLRDTAVMRTEDLVLKHLGKDITKPDFWKQGIEIMAEDARSFIELTNKYVKK